MSLFHIEHIFSSCFPKVQKQLCQEIHPSTSLSKSSNLLPKKNWILPCEKLSLIFYLLESQSKSSTRQNVCLLVLEPFWWLLILFNKKKANLQCLERYDFPWNIWYSSDESVNLWTLKIEIWSLLFTFDKIMFSPLIGPPDFLFTIWFRNLQLKIWHPSGSDESRIVVVLLNFVIRNFLVTLKLFFNAKCSLSLWS